MRQNGTGSGKGSWFQVITPFSGGVGFLLSRTSTPASLEFEGRHLLAKAGFDHFAVVFYLCIYASANDVERKLIH